MNENKKNTQTSNDALARRNFWGTLALAGILLLISVYFVVVLSKENPTTAIYIGTAAFFITLLITLISAALVLRRQQELGLKVLFYTLLALVATVTSVFQGRTLTASFAALVIAFILIRWLLPRQAWRWYTAVTATALILMWVMEWINPPWRVQVAAATVGPAGAVLFAIILAIVVAVQAWRGSLSTKLIVAFLAVTLIPLSVVFFLNNRTTTQILTNSSDAALQSTAAQTAAALDTFISERINDVRVESQKHALGEYLSLPSAERAGSETETVLYTDLLSIARRDQTFITSVGLINKNGLSVADTEPSEVGVDKSKRNYFIGARDTELPYVSPVERSATTGDLSMYFSAPVHDKNDNFIGVLRIRYNATVIQSIINRSAEKANISALSIVVFDENHIRLAHNLAPELILKSVVPLPASTVAKLQAERRLQQNKPVAELSTNIQSMENGLNNLDKSPIFIAEFHALGEGDEEGTAVRLQNQPWIVATGQSRAFFLAPLTQQTNTNAILALVIAGLVALAAVLVAQTIANPVVRLTSVAQQIATGNLNVQAKVESGDEIGTLASSFNSMTTQLRELITTLELRVADRTKALSSVAEISAVTSTILETHKLLQEVVDLSKERFNFYHAHIFLLNEAGDTLELANGAGEPGRKMAAQGLSIPLDRERSLVARAARERKGVTVNDVTQAPDFLPNPLLPNTRSELAVPMIVGENVIGVFDVQSDEIGRFTDADINIQSTLAAQVASAVQNATLYTQTQIIALEAQSLVDNAPEGIIIVDLETGLFANPNENAVKLYGLPNEELVKVGPAQMSPPRQPDGRDSTEKAMEKIGAAMQGKPQVFEWMHRNGQGEDILCEIRLVRLPGAHPRVRASVTDISERKRNEEFIKRSAEQQTALNLITQKIQNATTIEAALQVAARELGHALGMRPTRVEIDPTTISGERKADS